MDAAAGLQAAGTRGVHYLEEIADAADAAGYDATIYRNGIAQVMRELR